MKIPLHNLLTNLHRRSIFATEPGEVRTFVIGSGDDEKKVRATGTNDGGLKIERWRDNAWLIDATVTDGIFNGESIRETTQ